MFAESTNLLLHPPPSALHRPTTSRRVSSHHPLFLIDCPLFVALRTLFNLLSAIVCHRDTSSPILSNAVNDYVCM
ncbi:hypothetical protein BLNAU_1939 [Blattamonas nauphoetae]|uniref:Uncharacterized protein n=1 Tax=Blattamonas nauphoetae TaxID=2049346 RepID=A0ABQ9YGX9_9EUKA|nr:hypothetical protein BLNAU_1939 [Blattamonas nauphoetae]